MVWQRLFYIYIYSVMEAVIGTMARGPDDTKSA